MRLLIGVLLFALAFAVLEPQSVLAQAAKKAKTNSAFPAAGPTAGPMGGPMAGPMGGPMAGPGAGGAGKTAKPGDSKKSSEPKKTTGSAKNKPGPDERLPPDALPPGFEAPEDVAEFMKDPGPVIPESELEALKKEHVAGGKFQRVLVNGQLGAAEKKTVVGAIRYYLGSLTIPERLKPTPQSPHPRERLVKDLADAGERLSGNARRKFRDSVNVEIVNQIVELKLLQHTAPVRIQAVLLLGELESVKQTATNPPVPAEPYIKSHELLCEVVQDPQQPLAVKIPAVAFGLDRILRASPTGAPPAEVRRKIGEVMVKELAKKDAHWWYQWKLVTALGMDDIERDSLAEPFIYTTLRDIVLDPTRDWEVRTEAAVSLGRIPLDPAVDPQELTRCIAQATLDLADTLKSKQLPRDLSAKEYPKWLKRWTFKLYLAYFPEHPKELSAGQRRTAGLTNYPTPAVKNAASQAVTVCAPIWRALVRGESPSNDERTTLLGFAQPDGKQRAMRPDNTEFVPVNRN